MLAKFKPVRAQSIPHPMMLRYFTTLHIHHVQSSWGLRSSGAPRQQLLSDGGNKRAEDQQTPFQSTQRKKKSRREVLRPPCSKRRGAARRTTCRSLCRAVSEWRHRREKCFFFTVARNVRVKQHLVNGSVAVAHATCAKPIALPCGMNLGARSVTKKTFRGDST